MKWCVEDWPVFIGWLEYLFFSFRYPYSLWVSAMVSAIVCYLWILCPYCTCVWWAIGMGLQRLLLGKLCLAAPVHRWGALGNDVQVESQHLLHPKQGFFWWAIVHPFKCHWILLVGNNKKCQFLFLSLGLRLAELKIVWYSNICPKWYFLFFIQHHSNLYAIQYVTYSVFSSLDSTLLSVPT